MDADSGAAVGPAPLQAGAGASERGRTPAAPLAPAAAAGGLRDQLPVPAVSPDQRRGGGGAGPARGQVAGRLVHGRGAQAVLAASASPQQHIVCTLGGVPRCPAGPGTLAKFLHAASRTGRRAGALHADCRAPVVARRAARRGGQGARTADRVVDVGREQRHRGAQEVGPGAQGGTRERYGRARGARRQVGECAARAASHGGL